jgi:dynein heavy chain, axonemal
MHVALGYSLPNSANQPLLSLLLNVQTEMLQAIEALPLMQTPEVFGLHGNADIQYYSNATKDLWKNLIELQPRTAGSGGTLTRDDSIKQTAQDILNRIPDPFDLYVIKKETGVPSPTQIVLLQELERWNQCAPLKHAMLH